MSASRVPLKSSTSSTDAFAKERKDAIIAARGLCYGEDVVAQLRRAKNPTQMGQILATARIHSRDEEDYKTSAARSKSGKK